MLFGNCVWEDRFNNPVIGLIVKHISIDMISLMYIDE